MNYQQILEMVCWHESQPKRVSTWLLKNITDVLWKQDVFLSWVVQTLNIKHLEFLLLIGVFLLLPDNNLRTNPRITEYGRGLCLFSLLLPSPILRPDFCIQTWRYPMFLASWYKRLCDLTVPLCFFPVDVSNGDHLPGDLGKWSDHICAVLVL